MDGPPPALIERRSLADAHAFVQSDGRLSIDIDIDQNKQIYTEGDHVIGSTRVTATVNVFAPYIEIDFMGTCRTRWDNPLMGAGRNEGQHSFLIMSCPVAELPMLASNIPLSTSWHFTIPDKLLPTSCLHDADDDMRQSHLCLPPSMDRANSPLNPEAVRIVYTIRVRVNGSFSEDEHETTLIAEHLASIRFIPSRPRTVDFYPPLDVESYCSIREHRLERKGMRSTVSYGQVTFEATGLPSMTLDGPGEHELPRDIQLHRATSIGLRLTFHAQEANSIPPEASSISAKLGAVTCYSTTPHGRPPSLKRNISSQGYALETIRLPQRDMHNLNWQAKEIDGKSLSEAYLVYPIERASLDTLVPTFNSCLVSRHYRLSLKIILRHAGADFALRLEDPMLVAWDPSPSEQDIVKL